MSVLINIPGDPPQQLEVWRRALLALEPGLEVRIWPDTGPLEEVEFVLAWRSRRGDLARYPNLKAIFWLGAGIDYPASDPDLPRRVPFVRLVDEGLTAGMTEYVLLHVLRYHRQMPELEALQRQHRWEWLRTPLARERRIGIMGLGVLGGDAARRLAELGFSVAGWSRTPKNVPGVESFHGDNGLTPFLARSEILVCLLPLSPATRGIVNARTLAALPKGAAFINAGRGDHVVELDLLAALTSGQIAHATLDVFHEEPLPPEHPFWSHPCVTVTPHNASDTQPETTVEVVVEGMRRIRAGLAPAHLVDWSRGY